MKLTAVYENYCSEKQAGETRILRVPAEFQTIASAVEDADNGDWIILSKGNYSEQEIEIKKSITISSEWKFSGKNSSIEETVLDPQGKRLFIISSDDVEISGLKIVNGDHTLEISAKVTITHNHFVNNFDGISLESGSGGYISYNISENDKDDALDIDIGSDQNKIGSDVIVEHNTFLNCNDDGIEIRLFQYPDQNVNYTIRHNQIIGSKKAGIQLISYDLFTGKRFDIHHNIFLNCKTGLGCMEGAKTDEDLGGASRMDEEVCFYNNTVIGGEMGATGGNQIIAANNIISGNRKGGFKNLGPQSVIVNNLFFKNGEEPLVKIDSAALTGENLFSLDPLIDEINYSPSEESPVIDAGIPYYALNGKEFFRISNDQYAGDSPDLGAVEKGMPGYQSPGFRSFWVNAGDDKVFGPLSSEVLLSANVENPLGSSLESNWYLGKGPGKVYIQSPKQEETKVSFTRQGIYRFTIIVSDGENLSSDNLDVRYIEDGDGEQIFLKEDTENFIEMEEFSYNYGNVQMKEMPDEHNNKYMLLMDYSGRKSPGLLEYFVGMAESNEYNIWILAKPINKKNRLSFDFDDKSLGEIALKKSRKFLWIKVPGSIIAKPGLRTLLILNDGGNVLIDKMVFTENPDFNPN